MTKELREQEVAEFITKRLTEFGFIKGERKCYTPKYGDGAYTIEDWTAETIGIFLAQDIVALFDRYAAEREKQARIDELNTLGYETAKNDWHKGRASKMWIYIADRLKTLKGDKK